MEFVYSVVSLRKTTPFVYKSFAILYPPETIREPVCVFVALIVDVVCKVDNVPSIALRFPPILVFFATPNPPIILSAPVELLV
jgi:hypothetical protein